MKTKILPILVVVLLLVTAVNVIATDTDDDNNIKIAEKEDHISFSQATFETKGEYVSVNIEETDTYLRATGKPMLPVYTKTFTFPRGTKIKNVECTLSDTKSEIIDSKIQPAPKPIRLISLNKENQNNEEEIIEDKSEIIEDKIEIIEDQSVYSSSDLYPDNWYDYKILCGLDDGKDTIFVKVNSYPVRYSPAENTLYSIDSIDIKVTYEEGTNPVTSASEYDLLIITPNKFKLFLIPLYFHKTKWGVSTKIETVESIYSKGYAGDKPEQIKRFIAWAEENWNITYVLLVGGLKSYFNANDKDNRNEGSTDWYLPVRYANLQEPSYISDLYYADIYKYNDSSGQNEFNDWNPNENDIIADYYEYKDLDLVPDVYYGRLPCRNIFDVITVVKKIIRYERPSIISKIIGKPWMKRMIVVSGRNLPDLEYEGELDGEWVCNRSIEYMGDLITKPVRVFASNIDTGGPRPIPRHIVREFTKGAGFALLEGHGNAWMWDTNWPEWHNETEWHNWTGGITTFNFPFLINGRKLPIVVVGGCHNGIFNVSFMKTLVDIDIFESHYHAYGIPIRSCFSWKLCTKPRGGAIASTGCTDYGIGTLPPDVYSGGLEANFFYVIGHDEDNETTLGEAHGGSITKYIKDFEIRSTDAYCITEYQLFGDPSLKIGGY